MKCATVVLLVLVLSGHSGVRAQQPLRDSRLYEQDAWRLVAEPASAPLTPARPVRPVPPLSFEPLVLISESAPAPGQASTVYRLPPASAPVYALPPQPVPPPGTAYKPLVPLAAPPSQYYVGRGLLGQPKLYVPEQPIRNLLRYLSF